MFFFGVWEEQAAQRRGWHFLMTCFRIMKCWLSNVVQRWLVLAQKEHDWRLDFFLARVGRFLEFKSIDTTFWIQCHGDLQRGESR